MDHDGFTHKVCDWFVNTRGEAVPELKASEFLAKFRKLKFPGKQVDVDFDWHLRSYRDFAQLGRIAPKLGTDNFSDDAGAELVHFEFGAGKSCRLVASCNKKGKWKLFFNIESSDRPVLEE